MKAERKKQIKELIALFSEYIRKKAMIAVGGCERCGALKDSWKALQCAHCHDARIHATKFNELNAAGVCGGCHTFLDSHPTEMLAFFRARMTLVEWDALAIIAGMSSRNKRPLDYSLTKLYLKGRLNEVEQLAPEQPFVIK